jgi:hypothetical protein
VGVSDQTASPLALIIFNLLEACLLGHCASCILLCRCCRAARFRGTLGSVGVIFICLCVFILLFFSVLFDILFRDAILIFILFFAGLCGNFGTAGYAGLSLFGGRRFVSGIVSFARSQGKEKGEGAWMYIPSSSFSSSSSSSAAATTSSSSSSSSSPSSDAGSESSYLFESDSS